MKTYHDMASDVLRRRDEYIKEQKRKRQIRLKATSYIAVFCLVSLGVVGIVNRGILGEKRLPSVIGTDRTPRGTTNTSSVSSANESSTIVSKDGQMTDSLGRMVVSSYEKGGSYHGKYPAPRPGQAMMSIPLGLAMRDYGNSAIYAVEIYLMINEHPDAGFFDKKATIIASELERLKRHGYQVEMIKKHAGEPYEYDVLLGHVTLDQLERFPANPVHGIFISLKDEGPTHYK